MFLRFIHGVAWIRILFVVISAAIPWYGNATLCSSGHEWTSIWVVSSLGIMNTWLWTFARRSLCEHMLVFLAGRCLGVESLGHMVNCCLNFKETTVLFSTVAAPFYIPCSSVWEFRSHQHLLLSKWVDHSHVSSDAKRHLTVVSLAFPWCPMMVSVFACVYFGELSIKIFCPFFKSGCFTKFWELLHTPHTGPSPDMELTYISS